MKDQLCVHLKSLFSGLIPDDELQREIGRLINMDDAHFLDLCADIRYAIGEHLVQLPLNDADYKILRVRNPEGNIPLLSFTRNSIDNFHQITDEPLLNAAFKVYSSNPDHGLKLISGLMKLKTGRMIPGPSRSDEDKIFHSINDLPSQNLDTVKEIQKEIAPFMDRFLSTRGFIYESQREYKPLISVFGNVNKRSYVNLEHRNMTVPRSEVTAYNISWSLKDPRVYKAINRDPDSFISSVVTGAEVCQGKVSLDEPLSDELSVGYIATINEPGHKLRVVAVPNLLLACASAPLGKKLKELNSSWTVQGVDSHEQTVEFIHNHMKVDRDYLLVYHSIDMKNFTDRLPYEGLQRLVLENLRDKGLIRTFDIDIMDIICHGRYQYNKTFVQYGAGTPQGTEPSFPLCSFTNGMVAAIAFKHATRLEWKDINLNKLPCRVIGDDIVIWHDDTARKYKTFMRDLGVEISQDKCIDSPDVAEMCSKLISPFGIYQQKKIIRREDKLDCNGQESLLTIASRMDYYHKIDDSTLRRYIQNASVGDEDVLTILSAPRPIGGMGSDYREVMRKVLNSEPVTYIEAQALLDRMHSSLTGNKVPSRSSFFVLNDRKSLLPDVSYQLVKDPYENINTHRKPSPLLESLVRDFRTYSDELYKAGQKSFDLIPDTSRDKIAHAISVTKRLAPKAIEDMDKAFQSTVDELTRRKSSLNLLDRWTRKSGINVQSRQVVRKTRTR